MSVPNTMKMGPFTPTVLVKKKYLLFYVFLFWISVIPVLIEFWVYWRLLFNYSRPFHFFIYLPLILFAMYITLAFSAIFSAKILLVLVNKIHKPREGVFLRDPSDIDYRYWSIRNTIKKWPFWVTHKFPFPFMDNVCFKVFNVKTKIQNSLFEGWVDTEFIEFGTNVVIGQGSIIQSSVIIGNLLIIKKTIIEDNVRIGSHSVVMPGTHIGKNSILAAISLTLVGQELEEGYIYIGVPAKKYKKNRFFEDNIEDLIRHVEDVHQLREKYEGIYDKGFQEHSTQKARKELKRQKQEIEKRRLEKGV